MLYHLYSGHLFFSSLSMLIVLVAIDLSGHVTSRTGKSVLRIGSLVAIGLCALSSTPVKWWLAAAGLTAGCIHTFAGIGRTDRGRIVSGVATILAACVLIGFEIPHHIRSPEPTRPVRIIVIGDSMSSGGFGEQVTWPDVLGRIVGCRVVNLSRAGDTSATALEGQVADVPAVRRGDLVILEIGGNDMLDGRSARGFSDAVEAIAARVTGDERKVMMMELPLLPGKWGYGATQRRVAEAHGITLIPKRIIAAVLLDPEKTYDGLHLTQKGHNALARSLAEWAGWDRPLDAKR